MRAALYARVSSDLQEREETIQSQLAELRSQLQTDGVTTWEEFMDEGYSRDNFVRPGLDGLRDLATQGELDRVYIQCPDRLASGARLMLLVEELQHNQAEVVFLKGSTDDTPEGRLLLGMQGLIAEYETTKIAERTRRGKLYWARQGALLGGYVPYGYRYIPRDGDRRAHLVVDEDEASVVRQMYRWLTEEGLSLRAIAAKLNSLGLPTKKGGKAWRQSVVGHILRNEANGGTMYYRRHEAIESPGRKGKKDYRKNTKTSRRLRPREEWISIPVPAIINRTTWEHAQEQLRQNFLHSPRNNKRHDYLLRGLMKCGVCGFNYVGAAYRGRRYYRCCNKEPMVSTELGGCRAASVRADRVEEVVWEAVSQALQNPGVLAEEYRRRLVEVPTADALGSERKQLSLALRRLKGQKDRLIDAYKNEAIDLAQLKEEMGKLNSREQGLEGQHEALERRHREQFSIRDGLAHLEAFCGQVSQGLENLSFEERQKLLRLVVDRIVLDAQRVRVEAAIPLGSPGVFANLRPRCAHPETGRRPGGESSSGVPQGARLRDSGDELPLPAG